jgi:hypothetical protein
MWKGLGRVRVRLSAGRVVTQLEASGKLSAAADALLYPGGVVGN